MAVTKGLEGRQDMAGKNRAMQSDIYMGDDREVSDFAYVAVTYVIFHIDSVVSMYTDMHTIANAGPVSAGGMRGLYRRE